MNNYIVFKENKIDRLSLLVSDLHPIRELVTDERKCNPPFPSADELAGDCNRHMPGFHGTTCLRHSVVIGSNKKTFKVAATSCTSRGSNELPAIEDSRVLAAVLDASQELRRDNRSPLWLYRSQSKHTQSDPLVGSEKSSSPTCGEACVPKKCSHSHTALLWLQTMIWPTWWSGCLEVPEPLSGGLLTTCVWWAFMFGPVKQLTTSRIWKLLGNAHGNEVSGRNGASFTFGAHTSGRVKYWDRTRSDITSCILLTSRSPVAPDFTREMSLTMLIPAALTFPSQMFWKRWLRKNGKSRGDFEFCVLNNYC